MGDKTIFHIDANSAFLSWEAAQQIKEGSSVDLRQIPSVVGGDEKSRHGIVLAKSIPAKAFNIKTGESLFSARQKCPNLVVVLPRYEVYSMYSKALYELLLNYSPLVEPFSIDEYFLDYTNMSYHFGEPVLAAHKIKDHIKNELGFTVNIGVGPNKLLAKMAGDLKKPDKVHTVFYDEVQSKLWPLAVSDLFMVGRQTVKKLHAMSIYTIGELAASDPQMLEHYFKSYGRLIWYYANGREYVSSQVSVISPAPKSISNARTVACDIYSINDASALLLDLCENTCARMRREKFLCSLISISLRSSTFQYLGHQQKIPFTDCTQLIYSHAVKLLNEIWDGRPLRQIGICLSGFDSNQIYQCSLFDNGNIDDLRLIDRTLDNIRTRFGKRSVVRGSVMALFPHINIKSTVYQNGPFTRSGL